MYREQYGEYAYWCKGLKDLDSHFPSFDLWADESQNSLNYFLLEKLFARAPKSCLR